MKIHWSSDQQPLRLPCLCPARPAEEILTTVRNSMVLQGPLREGKDWPSVATPTLLYHRSALFTCVAWPMGCAGAIECLATMFCQYFFDGLWMESSCKQISKHFHAYMVRSKSKDSR